MNGYPLRIRGDVDASNRWLWLVKWLLLLPHYVVLALLWLAFIVLTVVAYIVVLFTGRYPQGIFTFNAGVMRWSWRVAFYGYRVLGTDRYPPFTLAEVPDYPASLTIEGPPRPRRWLPLVAWILVIPHLLMVGALHGAASRMGGDGNTTAALGPAVVGALFVAVSLLFRGCVPRGVTDLLIGIGRWMLRTGAYLALLVDRYPPFRLDQGGREPDWETELRTR